MNIALFTRAFSPSIGGLETIAEILAVEFSRRGHRVTVITDEPEVVPGCMSDAPFSVIRTQTFRGRVASFKGADVILFFNLSLIGLMAAWYARKPVVMSHHGIYQGRGCVAIVLEWVKRQLTRFFTNIAVSEFVARHIPGRSVGIRNAFDAAEFATDQNFSRERDFVFCGRLVPEKGGLLCLRAFKLVLISFPKSTLTVIGGGAESDALHRFVNDNQMSCQVAFCGELTGASLVGNVQRHTCMVVPSIWQEPFGIVALEGMAACDTVIATRSGGLPEALGAYGLLVEPNEESLSEAMISVLEAKQSGCVVPGSPDHASRDRHLAAHLPHVVASRYLDVICKGARNELV